MFIDNNARKAEELARLSEDRIILSIATSIHLIITPNLLPSALPIALKCA
jgi:hypothetical protein